MNKFKLPDTLVIASAILLITIVLTWIVPGGEFAKEVVDGREVIVPGTFQTIEPAPQSILTFFTAPYLGFKEAVGVIAFIFFIGGAFGMINATGAINAGLLKLVGFTLSNPLYKWVVIPLLILAFALAGGTFGMSEEVLVFVLITIPLAISLGYDRLVGVAIPLVGAGAGFAGAFLNPFTVGVAQGIAGIPLFSGMAYRIFAWVVFSLLTIAYIMFYISRLEKDKTISPIYSEDDTLDIDTTQPRELPLTSNRIIILLLFALAIVVLAWGVTQRDWYITEISGLFFGLGIFSALIGGLSMSTMVKAFSDGAKEMMGACLVVAFCRGILVIAEDANIIDTILNSMSNVLSDMPPVISAQAMFILQSFLNFFVPSGSGQAALTMPIMAPLGDLLGVSRQTAVLAFQFGDGLSNMVLPTSGVTMGVLSIARIPYDVWLRWMIPLMIIYFIAAMLLLAGPTVFFEWN
ncbi:MAG: putative basic amino acid antiporter YfcC [Gloeocapsa sp. DLM2.Bin57]|nr:MAG: putative basic amino acid antiporter YfcC [Gloeocapsa sp. DLM2.Bin57]